jgi:uncharacterized membrane protein
MKPLILLVATFILALLLLYFISGQAEVAFAGRIGMSVMLAFTAMGHFMYTKGMTMMIPAFIPYKKELVYITGIIEVAAAIGLQITSTRETTGWLLILFFLLLLPANINAALKHIDYQKGTFDGAGINYLWFRVPLQLLFLLWTYYFCLR